MKSLTHAYIKAKGLSDKIDLDLSDLNLNQLDSSKYFLIIQSCTKTFLKITLYPIRKKRIIKIQIYDKQTTKNKINSLKHILGELEIIHTTGLILEKEELSYECYLNNNINELYLQEKKDLLKRINKLKKMFKFLKIEEITLEKE
ncbi:MAG: hypothetical protein EU550_00455 [Promethearchaeota archaeon]|nr:MAG: hypothetical protein EU550_00455 [Candidatus Lokiarchaeota archaeon]